MHISISYQLLAAGAALSLGASLGILFDIFRVIRRHGAPRFLCIIMELLFAFFCGGSIFWLGLSAGHGEQRLYMTVLAFCGSILYFLLFSPLVLQCMNAAIGLIAKILYFLSAPVRSFLRILKKFPVFFKKHFPYWKYWYKISSVYNEPKRSRILKEEHPVEAQTHRNSNKIRDPRSGAIRRHISRTAHRQD